VSRIVSQDPPESSELDREQEILDRALDWVESTLARKVALYLPTILLPLATAGAYWLQDAIGIDMDPAVAVAFVVSIAVGIIALGATWVRNHGRGAAEVLQQVLAQVLFVRESGRQLEDPGAPSAAEQEPSQPIGTLPR